MAAKRAMVEPDHRKLNVSRQCDLLELSRASYYRTPEPESDENLMLMRLIDELYTRHPSLGSRSMRDRLRLKGH
ncbi:MAG: IS3 family transposase, partial [Thermoleophilia bacterium]